MKSCSFIKDTILKRLIDWLNYPLWCFFGSEGQEALNRNPGFGYNTLLLRLILGDLLSTGHYRQFHTLPSLLDNQAGQSNSYPNTCVQCREAVCTIFIMVFGITRLGREPTTYCVKGGHANH